MNASIRCTRTMTTLPPSVAKNAALPLMARDNTDARMTMRTASNADWRCRRLKSCGEVTIDLERDHRPRALDERARQRAAAGSDFDEELIGFRIDGADHFVDPDPLEKVLAEPLLMLAGPPSLR